MKKYTYHIAFSLFFNGIVMGASATQTTTAPRKFKNQIEYDVTEDEVKGHILRYYQRVAQLKNNDAPFPEYSLFYGLTPYIIVSHNDVRFNTGDVNHILADFVNVVNTDPTFIQATQQLKILRLQQKLTFEDLIKPEKDRVFDHTNSHLLPQKLKQREEEIRRHPIFTGGRELAIDLRLLLEAINNELLHAINDGNTDTLVALQLEHDRIEMQLYFLRKILTVNIEQD